MPFLLYLFALRKIIWLLIRLMTIALYLLLSWYRLEDRTIGLGTNDVAIFEQTTKGVYF